MVESVPFQYDGFLAGTEVLLNGMLMGYRAAEYPAVLHSWAWGTSKAKLVRTIWAHLNSQSHVLLVRLSVAQSITARHMAQG